MRFYNNLKKKWGIKSNYKLIIIFIVFAITGSLSLIISDPLLSFLKINKDEISILLFIPSRIIIVFIVYQILILVIGFIFGQFSFFWQFEKKIIKKILKK